MAYLSVVYVPQAKLLLAAYHLVDGFPGQGSEFLPVELLAGEPGQQQVLDACWAGSSSGRLPV
jgi:hypothetical protein